MEEVKKQLVPNLTTPDRTSTVHRPYIDRATHRTSTGHISPQTVHARLAIGEKQMTEYELLLWYTPPLTVINFLQETAKANGGMSIEAEAWLNRVIAARTGDPIPEVDAYFKPVQKELVKEEAKYE